jgi:hypothetical protein
LKWIAPEIIHSTFTLVPSRARNGRAKPPPVPESVPQGKVPRVTRLLALAHHYEELRRSGLVDDYADLARNVGVTRARMTQIMSLLNLAPDIQQAILDLPRTTSGVDPISTRAVLPIAARVDWEEQRRAWALVS